MQGGKQAPTRDRVRVRVSVRVKVRFMVRVGAMIRVSVRVRVRAGVRVRHYCVQDCKQTFHAEVPCQSLKHRLTLTVSVTIACM